MGNDAEKKLEKIVTKINNHPFLADLIYMVIYVFFGFFLGMQINTNGVQAECNQFINDTFYQEPVILCLQKVGYIPSMIPAYIDFNVSFSSNITTGE